MTIDESYESSKEEEHVRRNYSFTAVVMAVIAGIILGVLGVVAASSDETKVDSLSHRVDALEKKSECSTETPRQVTTTDPPRTTTTADPVAGYPDCLKVKPKFVGTVDGSEQTKFNKDPSGTWDVQIAPGDVAVITISHIGSVAISFPPELDATQQFQLPGCYRANETPLQIFRSKEDVVGSTDFRPVIDFPIVHYEYTDGVVIGPEALEGE